MDCLLQIDANEMLVVLISERESMTRMMQGSGKKSHLCMMPQEKNITIIMIESLI